MRPAVFVGATIARRYELTARLGIGASGDAFFARDRDGSVVVVKSIDRSRVTDEDISRYIQTAASLAAIGTNGVVGPRDVALDLDLGLLVVAREPMRGLDVASIAAVTGAMDPLGALLLVAAACDAVAAAHDAGTVLLGVRPTNVFVEPAADGAVRVRVCDPAPSIALVLGSDGAAPELVALAAAGADADARADVYGLGALLFRLLAGARADAEPRALGEAAPWVAPEVRRIVDGALAKDPRSRIAKASLFASMLREAAGETTLRASMLAPVSDATRASRPPDAMDVPPSDPNRDPLIGHKLGGHYVIERALGRGGMGAVYEVTAPSGEKLAAKVIARGRGTQTKIFARFLREAQSATKIVDPHVARTVELGTDMTLGAPFMVMDLLRGRDLASVLREHRALDPIVAVRIFVQAARGLAAAHAAGVVHRDVKPANIFLSTDERGEVTVKICDFGLAKSMGSVRAPGSDLTSEGGVLGTPAYMSPEQAMGSRDVDARSDLFGLCASLYEALAGLGLWASFAVSGAELLHVICTRAFEPLDRVMPGLSPSLVAVVHRGLARAPRDRWPDANALVEALREHTSGSERITVDDLRASTAPRRSSMAPSDELDPSASMLSPLPMNPSTQAYSPPSAPREPPMAAEPPRRRRATLFAAALAAVAIVGTAMLATRSRAPEIAAPSASFAPPPPSCVSNAECTDRLQRASICSPRGACVSLASDECVVRIPASGAPAEGTVFFGAMFPMSGDGYASLWEPAARSVELAVRDFDDILGGIRNARADGPARPIGLVSCDDADDDRASRAARHLVEDLGVPAVIGFRSSKELLTLATSEFLPRGVLAVATFNKSALISSIPHPTGSARLVWRLAPSNAQDAIPLSAVVEEILEPELRRAALGRTAPMRVTFVRPDTATGIGFEDGLLARLRYNGRSLADNRESFQEIVFDENAANPAASVAEKIIAFRPHVIIYPGDSITARLPEAVERLWRGPGRPRYVFGTPLQDEALKKLVEARPDLAPRVLGISLPAATIQNVKLAAHYTQAFGAEQTATTTTPNAYDAVYLLAYAAMASGEDAFTGAGLARGIERLLPPGDALDVGPARILEAFTALRAGKKIDLTGASGPLDFDTTSGDAQFDYVFECFALDRGHARRTETALRWDLRTKKLVGTLTCR